MNGDKICSAIPNKLVELECSLWWIDLMPMSIHWFGWIYVSAFLVKLDNFQEFPNKKKIIKRLSIKRGKI